MADSLTSLANVKTTLGIPSAVTTFDTLFNMLIEQVSATIIESCNRPWLLVTNGPVTRYLNGSGTDVQVLPDWPIRQAVMTGTTASGSTTVSSLSPTSPWTVAANLFAGQSIRGSGIPVGACVVSVGASSVVISEEATASASVSLTFGLGVWEDHAGSWGQGSTAFDSDEVLTVPSDYVLDVDQADGLSSKSGLLYRRNNVWGGTYPRQPLGLATYGAPGMGNVKVVANAGYTAVPSDLEMAALRVIARVRASRRFGQLIGGGGYEGANVNFAPEIAAALGVLGGDAAAVIARYRVDAIPIG